MPLPFQLLSMAFKMIWLNTKVKINQYINTYFEIAKRRTSRPVSLGQSICLLTFLIEGGSVAEWSDWLLYMNIIDMLPKSSGSNPARSYFFSGNRLEPSAMENAHPCEERFPY